MYCNFVDDLEFHHDDTVGHLSFVDAFPSFGVAPDLEGVEGEPSSLSSGVCCSQRGRNGRRECSSLLLDGQLVWENASFVLPARAPHDLRVAGQERGHDRLHADCGLDALRVHDHRLRCFPSERFTVRTSHLPSTSLLFDFVLHQDGVDIDKDTQ